MEAINERFCQVLKDSGLSQEAFAKAIKRGRGEIANIVYGKTEPKGNVIEAVCEKFSINETWLRTGAGEMHVPLSRDSQLAKIFARVQVSDDERARLVKAFSSLPDEAYPQLYRWFQEMAKNLAGE